MSKITISICKVYKNTGRFRFHRKKTKPSWKHYFLTDDYTDDFKFGTEWIDSFTAGILKLKKHHKKLFLCPNCTRFFYVWVKNNRQKVYCQICPDKIQLVDKIEIEE